MTADTPYQILQFLSNKEQMGYLSPDQYNLIINQSQTNYLSFLLGEFQQYQYGRAIAKVELGMNERILQTLAPFIDKPSSLTVTPDGIDGFATYPADYEQIVSMNWGASRKRVRFVQQDSYYSYKNSRIDPVATNPIYMVSKDGFIVAPSDIGTTYMSYVATPATIVWNSVDNIFGQPIYDPTTSVSPLWYNTDMFQIIVRAAQMLGINLSAQAIEQYATQIKTVGE